MDKINFLQGLGNVGCWKECSLRRKTGSSIHGGVPQSMYGAGKSHIRSEGT